MRYTQDIVFCFDGDSAGQTAAWRAMMNALSAVTDNVRLKFLFLPKDHDPDTYIRENSKEAFDTLADDKFGTFLNKLPILRMFFSTLNHDDNRFIHFRTCN